MRRPTPNQLKGGAILSLGVLCLFIGTVLLAVVSDSRPLSKALTNVSLAFVLGGVLIACTFGGMYFLTKS